MGLGEVVLIIEDDKHYAGELAEALEAEGHDVAGHAGDIDSAHAMIDEKDFTVVSVDGSLGEGGRRVGLLTDGIEVALAVRNKKGSDAVVIAHTSSLHARYGDVFVEKVVGPQSAQALARAVTDIPKPYIRPSQR